MRTDPTADPTAEPHLESALARIVVQSTYSITC